MRIARGAVSPRLHYLEETRDFGMSQELTTTWTIVQDICLPFFNAQAMLGGSRTIKWNRNQKKRNMIAHCRSGHPQQMKRNVVKKTFRTTTVVCSDESKRKGPIALAKPTVVFEGCEAGRYDWSHNVASK